MHPDAGTRRPKVFLCGEDGSGWALDEARRLAQWALEPLVEFTDLRHAEVVYAVWWQGLAALPVEQLHGKRVVCCVAEDVAAFLGRPEGLRAREIVTRWMSRCPREQARAARRGD